VQLINSCVNSCVKWHEIAIQDNDYYGQQTLVIMYDTRDLKQDIRGYDRVVRCSPAPPISHKKTTRRWFFYCLNL